MECGKLYCHPHLTYICAIFRLNYSESSVALNPTICIFSFKGINLRGCGVFILKSLVSGMADWIRIDFLPLNQLRDSCWEAITIIITSLLLGILSLTWEKFLVLAREDFTQAYLQYFLLITKELSGHLVGLREPHRHFWGTSSELPCCRSGSGPGGGNVHVTCDCSALINPFLQMGLLSSWASVNSPTVLGKHLEQTCTL